MESAHDLQSPRSCSSASAKPPTNAYTSQFIRTKATNITRRKLKKSNNRRENKSQIIENSFLRQRREGWPKKTKWKIYDTKKQKAILERGRKIDGKFIGGFSVDFLPVWVGLKGNFLSKEKQNWKSQWSKGINRNKSSRKDHLAKQTSRARVGCFVWSERI